MLVTAGLTLAIGVVAVGAALALFGVLGLLVLAGSVWLSLRGQRSLTRGQIVRALRAQPIHPTQAPLLADAVRWLAARAQLTRPPALALLPSPSLNAMATGTEGEGLVAVTPALLRSLTPRQLLGVLAHEISHIRSADLRVTGLASALSRVTQTVSFAGTMLLLLGGPGAFAGGLSVGTLLAVLWAPNVATLLFLALSRAREHQADADAVALTGDPEGLAQALLVLDRHADGTWESAAAHRLPSWLRTHPTTEDRVRRLRAMTGPAASGHAVPGRGAAGRQLVRG